MTPQSNPSPDALAIVAAILATRPEARDCEPEDLAGRALRLWRACAASTAAPTYTEQARAVITEAVPQSMIPKDFPATFATFSRLVIRAKDTTDGTKRMRAFLRDRLWSSRRVRTNRADAAPPDPQEVAKALADIRRDGFAYRAEWLASAREYLEWNRSQVSAQRREANRRRKPMRRLEPLETGASCT